MGTTTTRTAGSMGATRCACCGRTTEFQVVVRRRRVLGAIPLEREYLARCTVCDEQTPISVATARRALTVRASCELRPVRTAVRLVA